MKKLRVLDSAILLVDKPELGLKAGDGGTVIRVYGDGEGYEVEFTTLTGQTLGVLTLTPEEVRPVEEREPLHVRQLG